MGRLTRLSRRAVVGGLAGIGASAAGLSLMNGCGLMPSVAKPRVARIGFAWSGNQGSAVQGSAAQAVAFRAGLRDAGWVEGQNVVIDERHYEDHPERMPDQAAELVAGTKADRTEVLADRILLYVQDGDAALDQVRRLGLEPLASLVRRSTLEDVFLRLTGRRLED